MKKKKYLKKALIYLVILILFIFAVNPALIPFTSEEFKESVGNTWGSLFGDVGEAISIFTVNWAAFFKLIAMILLVITLYSLTRFILSRIRPRTSRGRSALSLLNNGASYLFVIIGIIWGLSIIGVNITAIFAGIGILALVISFGAESLIEDIITGVFLVFDRQFNVGDIIEIDGFRGVVEQIGVRSTYIKNNEGNILILNNSSIKKVMNRSVTETVAHCDVSVSYDADLERVEEVLKAALPGIRRKYPEVFLADPEYRGVQELGSSSVVLRVIASVNEGDIYQAPRYMLREIKLAFDKAGVEIPFPQVVIHESRS